MRSSEFFFEFFQGFLNKKLKTPHFISMSLLRKAVVNSATKSHQSVSIPKEIAQVKQMSKIEIRVFF